MTDQPVSDRSQAQRVSVADLAFLVYDHLGSALVLNLLWVALAVPWLAAATVLSQVATIAAQALQVEALHLVGVGAGLLLLLYSPPSLLLLASTAPWVRGQDTPSRQQLWQLLRARFWSVQAMGMVISLLAAMLLVNTLFYYQMGGWYGAVLSGFMLWLVLALVVMTLYWLPLLVQMPTLTLMQVVRQGLLLVFQHPGNSLITLALMLVILALGLVSGIGWLCGLGTVAALQLNLGLARLLVLHGAAPIPSPSRSWRQILRPWE